MAACNSKPAGSNEDQAPADSLTLSETSDSIEVYQDSLAFWTDDEIVREHGQLVNLAQHMWRMSRNDTIEGNMDFIMAEMERVNPLLVTYFDSHYSPGKLNEAQKIDSVLNEIEAVYVPMAGGPTMSSIVGLDVHIAVDRYRECVNYARMWQCVPDGPLRAALHDEMVKWKAIYPPICQQSQGCFSGEARYRVRQALWPVKVWFGRDLMTKRTCALCCLPAKAGNPAGI